MKKYVTLFALLCLIALMTCTTALAADTEITVKETAENVSAVPDGEKINVVYSAAEDGSQYLVLATTEDAREEDGGTVVCKPTKDNIIYIDQTDAAGAADGQAAFVVYPSELEPGTYYIFLSSNAGSGIQGLTEIASFELPDGTTVVILGDVDGNGERSIYDVLDLVQLVVRDVSVETAGAFCDVDGDGKLTIYDVLDLVQMVVRGDTGRS